MSQLPNSGGIYVQDEKGLRLVNAVEPEAKAETTPVTKPVTEPTPLPTQTPNPAPKAAKE